MIEKRNDSMPGYNVCRHGFCSDCGLDNHEHTPLCDAYEQNIPFTCPRCVKEKKKSKPTMKQFYVLWTYVANFSRLISIQAESAEQAYNMACGYFGKDFTKKATVFVFDSPPCMIQHEGEKMGVEQYFDTSIS